MSYSIEEKKRILAKCLGISEDSISISGRYFELDDGSEYLVLDEEEREEELQDNIKETCSYFIPEFLAEETELPIEVFKALVDKNEAVYKLLEKWVDGGFEQFCEDAVNADGYGHFLSGYDGEELELTDDLFAYRTN